MNAAAISNNKNKHERERERARPAIRFIDFGVILNRNQQSARLWR